MVVQLEIQFTEDCLLRMFPQSDVAPPLKAPIKRSLTKENAVKKSAAKKGHAKKRAAKKSAAKKGAAKKGAAKKKEGISRSKERSTVSRTSYKKVDESWSEQLSDGRDRS
jgi:hypothetical protein